MNVNVTVPDATFWKLADIAEPFDMRVDEYLAEMAVSVARRKSPLAEDPVVARVREGLTDKEIGRDLGLTNIAVAERRRRAGFPANRVRS